MATLYDSVSRRPAYWDRRSFKSPREWFEKLAESSTLYVGNLSFYVTEQQVFEHFASCGTIEKIVIGLNSVKKQPCGFCFVRFSSHAEASYAHTTLNGSVLDGQIIRCDFDAGSNITADRKFGRGLSGGQIRDERL